MRHKTSLESFASLTRGALARARSSEALCLQGDNAATLGCVS